MTPVAVSDRRLHTRRVDETRALAPVLLTDEELQLARRVLRDAVVPSWELGYVSAVVRKLEAAGAR